MTDHEKTNHWKSLAKDLGASTPPDNEDTPLHTVSEPPVVEAKRSGDTGRQAGPKAPPRRSAPGWADLAQQFGLPRQDEPGKPSAAPRVVSAASSEVSPPPVETPRAGEPEDVSPRSAMENEAPLVEEEGIDVEAVERRSAPKRRRRRRRSRKPEGETAATVGADHAIPEPDAVELGEEGISFGLTETELASKTDEATGEAEESPKAGESAAGRPKRRRRRSSRKKSSGKGEAEASPATGATASMDEHPLDEDEADDDEDLDAESSADEASAAHRAIPSWQEAVGMIVSANIEARAKRPGGDPSSRSRGGRGRGGRNGSGSRKTKPS